MSRSIDERVVEMRFQNEQFEANAKQTMSTLDKLKSKLNFTGTKDAGLGSINNAIETVKVNFSALEVMAITALSRITNAAINLGTTMVKSLTLDQVTAGFSKYEQKTTAVQTIMNATGLTIEEVEKELEKLTWFTDETSYDFSTMVSEIGKFTSIGRELPESVTAMQGIANWAAVSGQSAETASRAMYNFSQAMGAGAMRLQDWKSIENANMATKEFKETVIESAVELGRLRKEADGTYRILNPKNSYRGEDTFTAETFSSTLAADWFDVDVMMATLDKYGSYADEVFKVAQEEGITAAEAMKRVSEEYRELGAKAFKAAQQAKTFTDAINATKDAVSSGWMRTFEIIFGNYEEAVELWTGLTNELWEVFASSSEARNEMLSEWKAAGGRDVAIKAITIAYKNLKEILQAVAKAFRNVFPKLTADRLIRMTDSLKEFATSLKVSDENLEKITRTFQGLFAALDIVKELILSIAKGALSLFKKAFKTTTPSVLNFTASIGDNIMAFRDWIKENNIFGNAVSKVVNFITQLVVKVKELVVAFAQLPIVQSFIGAIIKSFEVLIGLFIKGKDKLVEFIGGLESVNGITFESLKNNFNNILNIVDSNLDKVNSTTKSKFKVATRFLNNYKTSLDDFVGSIGVRFTNLEDTFDKAGDRLASSNINIGTIITTAFGLGATGLVFKMSSVVDSIRTMFVSISTLFANLNSSIKYDKIVKISKAITLLSISMFLLSKIDQQSIGQVMVLFSEIATVIGGLYIAVEKFSTAGSGAKSFGNGLGLLAVAGSLLILAFTLKKLESVDMDNIKGKLKDLTIIIGILIGAFTALNKLNSIKAGGTILEIANSKVKFNRLGSSSGAKGLIGAIIGLYLFVKLLENLNTLDVTQTIKTIESLKPVFSAFAAVLLSTQFAGKNAAKAGVFLIAIPIALKILMETIKDLALIPRGVIRKAMDVIEDFSEIFSLLIVASMFSGKNAVKAGIMLLSVSASIAILVTVMGEIANLPDEGLAKALKTIEELAIVFGALMIVSKFSGGGKLNIVPLLGAVVLLASILALMSTLPADAVEVASNALTKVLGVFAILMLVSNAAATSGAAILALSLFVGALFLVFREMAKIPVESIDIIGDALSETLLVISAAAFIMSKIPVWEAIEGALAFDIFVGNLSLVFMALGKLVKDNATFERGIDLLTEIGQGIGEFIGKFAGGLFAGLEQIGTYLSNFIQNASVFVAVTSSFTEDQFAGLDILMNSILNLVKAEFLKGVSDFLGVSGSLTSFGEELVKFVGPFSVFAASINAIDADAVEKAAIVGNTIAAIVGAIPKEGGIYQKIMGESNLAKFGAELALMAPSLVLFSNIVSQLDTDAIEKAEQSAGVLKAFVDAAPREGGLLQDIFGEKDLSIFSSQLPELGTNLKTFGDNVSGMDSDIVTNAASCAEALANVVNNLPRTGGALQDWIGTKDLSGFSSELPDFGTNLKAFSDNVAGFSPDAITAATDTAKTLVELSANLPATDGKLQEWFGGTVDLATYSAQLVLFGLAMVAYSDAMAGVNYSRLKLTTPIIETIVDLANKLPAFDYINNSTSIETFGEGLKKFGKLVFSKDGFYGWIALVDTEKMDTVTDSLDRLIDVFLKMGEAYVENMKKFAVAVQPIAQQLVTALYTNFNSEQETAMSSIGTFVNGMILAFEDYYTVFEEVGKEFIVKLRAGMGKKEPETLARASSIATNSATRIRSFRTNFKTAGEYLVDGFIKGIEGKIEAAAQKAAEMARAAYSAAMAELDIHSPSRKGIYLGQMFDEGVAIGFERYSYVAENASAEMAGASVNAMRNAISTISEIVESDMDTTPIITPVLDLSNVKAESEKLDGMFNLTRTITLTDSNSRVLSTAASMNRIIDERITPREPEQQKETNFSFVQNNYSPTALSRVEIYRQTKNQFSAMKGVLSSL